MHNLKDVKSSSIMIIMAVLLAILPGCSEKVVNSDFLDQGTIRISASLDGIAYAGQVSYGSITVTGPGIIEPIVSELIVENGYLVGEVIVPAGRNRVFRIEVYDKSEVLIYTGRTTVNVASSTGDAEPLLITINLYPQVPMMKIVPGTITALEYSNFAVDLKVYNISELNQIEFSINYDYYLLYVDSFELNPGLGSNVTYYYIDQSGFAIGIQDTITGNMIVDDTGYAYLGTLYFSTYNVPYGSLADTTELPLEIHYMADNEGNSIFLEQVAPEGSVVELLAAEYFLSGNWLMNEYEGDAVYDSSGNGLDGLAYGTTINEGSYGMARYFNGSSDYIEVGDDDLLDITEGITIELEVLIEDGSDDAVILSKQGANGNANFMLEYRRYATTGDQLILSYGLPPRTSFVVPINLADNEWHYIIMGIPFTTPVGAFCAVDWQTRTMSVPNMSSRQEVLTNDGSLLFGRQPGEDGLYLMGGLDNISIYRTALSESMFDVGK
nr:hypothetical protein [candidate division Zixibacteria bacterium]